MNNNRLPAILNAACDSPNVSPAFKDMIRWPKEDKKEKKHRQLKYDGVKVPHALTGESMRKYFKKKEEMEYKIAEEKKINKVKRLERAENKKREAIEANEKRIEKIKMIADNRKAKEDEKLRAITTKMKQREKAAADREAKKQRLEASRRLRQEKRQCKSTLSKKSTKSNKRKSN